MTIFRSKLLPTLAALVIMHGVARAQDSTTAVPRDTTPAVQSRTHVVQTGETLWSLAEQYLGDALLWPAIYRLNTLVVEDPHWIYPGEELRLIPPDSILLGPGGVAGAEGQTVFAGRDTITGQLIPQAPSAALPAESTQAAMTSPNAPGVAAGDLPPPPPPMGGEGGRTIFAPPARATASAVGSSKRNSLRAVSSSDFYAAGFLTENDRLPWADVQAVVGKQEVGDLANMSSARIFESVEVRAPQAASYQIGDTLLVARIGREISKWGNVVIPSGIVRVRESSGRRVVADVLVQYNRVLTGQVAMPVEPFRSALSLPTPIDNGMAGTIIDMRDVHALPGDLNIVFIDRGREDGVTPGDIFEVLRPNPPQASPETPLQQVAVMQVVHVRQRSASAQVIQISGLGVKPGAPVRLIRKMPS